MCGRIIALTRDEVLDVIAHLEVGAPLNIDPDWPARRAEAFPGSRMWAIAPAAEGTLRAIDLIWGYRVEWNSRLVYNTRIETAARPGGMWADSIENRRCVVPTLGFFEPHRTQTMPSPRTGRPVKRPYVFSSALRHADEQPHSSMFAPALTLLGGVYENGRLSIVTTEPNAAIAPVHDRMPLVLAPDEIATWFSPDYPALADRSSIPLASAPAPAAAARGRGSNRRGEEAARRSDSDASQLSLF